MKSIVLDNGIEYLIMDKKVIDGTEYTLFSNINDEDDFCFRKTVIENGESFFAYLDDEDEFKKVVLHFTKSFV